MMFDTVGEIEAPEFDTVPAETSLRDVIEKMLTEQYSQFGITRGGKLIGAVSYQSIARALVATDELFDSPKRLSNRTAELAVEKPRIVDHDDEFNTLFSILGERSYVLVDSPDGYRIVTDYDIREFWRESTQPFLLIEGIENAIRSIIRDVYGNEVPEVLRDLSSDSDHLRLVESLDECSFSHYEFLFSKNWSDGFDEFFHERQDFVRQLVSRIGEHRNRLFHFRIEDRGELDLDIIEFAHGYITAVSDNQRPR
ncbi:CBS domain-containing protein (plasmid) [Haloferax larsenii]|uniref:CBS domain-containing protein n=2 Tax=Haloferax TaxID=2251 RepID=A0ACD5HZM1_9EURY|nr:MULTISPECIES: CBS domain-containing protein [Haloferax]RDZ29836.1 hypothetical protein DEQ67_17660 [Haloferax sp. Atlit-48N]UVE51971.1 CBS domain-containing protein [Haloferax larsenii]